MNPYTKACTKLAAHFLLATGLHLSHIYNVSVFNTTGTTMTVRRYSMSSSLTSTPGYSKSSVNMKRNSSTGTLDLNGTVQKAGSDNEQLLTSEKGKSINIPVEDLTPKSSSFQEHMRKCRGKVKAVTFLLPTDMQKYQETQKTLKGSENQSKNHLSTIMEKDP
ncbi:hypothetical protein XENTR_v10014635 [Xenopus tropicalis]|uniref:Coiled-coil domain-containing protein 195 n=1 Tax=Xenopus tropicalis TaxID=8364 RepID=A0A8J1JPB5_XENTR|nr:putative coiled-coil domain-containing protein 195 [Xenopus tropicalis]KAE8604242.1 hypothetical protein XENTR_v10014635 [Xenopus tropicalis]